MNSLLVTLVAGLRNTAMVREPVSRIRLQALAGGAKVEVIDEINGWLVR